MKAFIAIQLLLALLAATVAADSVRGARELKKGGNSGDSGDATITASPEKPDVELPASRTAKKITEFRQVELSYRNMKPLKYGVGYSAGIANVKLDYDPNRSPQYQICITNNVVGFTPTQLHITKANINQSGDEVVDFTTKLKPGDPICSNCCVAVGSAVFKDIKANPVRRRRPMSTMILPLCQ